MVSGESSRNPQRVQLMITSGLGFFGLPTVPPTLSLRLLRLGQLPCPEHHHGSAEILDLVATFFGSGSFGAELTSQLSILKLELVQLLH